MSRWKPYVWIIGVCTAVFGVAYWVHGMDSTKEEVSQQRQAIVKIAERVNKHITEVRYQDCFDRNVPPVECPPDPEPLPPPRPRAVPE